MFWDQTLFRYQILIEKRVLSNCDKAVVILSFAALFNYKPRAMDCRQIHEIN